MRLRLPASPVLRLTVGLVGLAACFLISIDLLFGSPASREDQAHPYMEAIAELGTREIVEQFLPLDHEAIEHAMDKFRRSHPMVLAVVVRDKAGALVASSGVPEPGATLSHIQVAIQSRGGAWGSADFAFASWSDSSGAGWLNSRRLLLPLGTALGMVVLIYFYLRRALHFLDPSAVVPDRVRTAFDGLTEGVVVLDLQGQVVLANKAFRQMASADAAKLNGRPLLDAARLELPAGEATTTPWESTIMTGVGRLGLFIRMGPVHDRRAGHLNCSPITDARGKVRGCLVTVADMTAVEKANIELHATLQELEHSRAQIELQNKELEHLASRDGLTGLLNRRTFFDRANACLSRATRTGQALAVFMMDIDHFKSFNDRYGHSTGDVVIQGVARHLQKTLRLHDLAGRYGGEEFCVLCEDIDEAAAAALAERIRVQVEREAGRGAHGSNDLSVTVSIGVATTGTCGTSDLASLIELADSALYAAKQSGRNRVCFAPRASLQQLSIG